jgi:Skp family chaperone for outer membrane proteins
MNTFRAPLIAALTMVASCAAFAQQGTVRIITPDSEHVYSADPRKAGQLLDDEALQRENELKQRAKMQRIENARRQEELDAEQARLNAEAAQAAAAAYEEQQLVGSSYVGTFGIRHRRHVILQRPGTMGAVSGSSSSRVHARLR